MPRRPVEAARRAVLATSATPLLRLWTAAYTAAGTIVARRLARRYRASVFVRGAAATGRLVPGLSDIDLIALAPAGAPLPEPPRERALARLVQADLYRADDLAAVLGSTHLTFGLETGAAAYHGARIVPDPTGLLDRPGLPPDASRWRRLAGPDVDVPVPQLDRQATLVAAWLELVTWWRFGLEALAQPESAPSDAYLCVKLVAEPLRVLLALDGVAADGREEALALGASVAPELAAEIDRARALLQRLPRSPEAPFRETLPVLVALSQRVARRIGDELPEGERVRLVRAAEGGPPLADWRAVVVEGLPGERLALADADASNVDDLRRLCEPSPGSIPVVRAGEILVEPASDPWYAGRARTLQACFTDPVSFALLDGRAEASFPAVRGWSAVDWARRAVAERSAWLAAACGEQARPASWRTPPDAAGATPEVARRLLGTARAALFALSLSEGEPTLLLDAVSVGATAGAEAASVAESLGRGEPPGAVEIGALRETVRSLLARAREENGRC